MRGTIRVININTARDVAKIRDVLANTEGVLVCEIDKNEKVVNLIYDEVITTIDNVITILEEFDYYTI